MAKLYSLKEIHELEQVSPSQIKEKIPLPNYAPSQKFTDELILWKTAVHVETFEKEDFQIK